MIKQSVCPECEALNRWQNLYCTRCGASMHGAVIVQEASKSTEEDTPRMRVPGWLKWLLLGLLLPVVFIAGSRLLDQGVLTGSSEPPRPMALDPTHLLCGISIVLVFAIPLLLIVLLLPPLLHRDRLNQRAQRDYREARGTYHLNQLRQSLTSLDAKLEKLGQQESQLNAKIHSLHQQRQQELLRALNRHVAQAYLTDIDGIGPKLRDRILQECFSGTLDSLLVAYCVQGVGEKRALDIRVWVQKWKQQLPELAMTDFPGKRRIVASYEQKLQASRGTLESVQKKSRSLQRLRKLAVAEQERLAGVTVSHFRQAYNRNSDSSEVIDHYLQGVFAEWAPMPAWFKQLIGEFGG